jgi:hypothetical protein
MKTMLSIGKRAAGVGAVVAALAIAGPVAGASAAILPTPAQTPAPVVSPATPFSGAYQAGIDAAVGGWNAGAQAAAGGWNAGAAALGLPFQFTAQNGPFGVQHVGVAPLLPTP